MDENDDNVLRQIRRELPVILTDSELLAKGDQVAKLHSAASELRIEKKRMTDEISGEIKGKEGAISVLVRQIRTRSEHRDVGCKEIADYGGNVVHVVRDDTGQVIETRALLDSERQRPLPLKGVEGGKKKSVRKHTEAAPVGAE